MNRAVLAAVVAFVVLLVGVAYGAVLLLRWLLAPPLSRAQAQTECAEWVAERWTGATPRLTSVTVEDATDHRAWIVTGTLSDGAISGPYSCSISWASDGGAIYLDEIKLPDGYLGGIKHETAS